MTTYSFPSVTPTVTEIQLVSNTAISVSPINGVVQSKDRGGERWVISMTFQNLKSTDRSAMTGFIVRLNGQQHRFTLHNHAEPQLGNLGGTPGVSGASQTGSSLNIDGCTASQTPWIAAGDWFSVNGELKQCVADADSDGSGNVTVEFRPRLREAPADSAPLVVASATGTFLLAENTVKWSNRPGGFSDVSITAIEDIGA